MKKKYLITQSVICPTCFKERIVSKWGAGELCNSCRAKINCNGKKRKHPNYVGQKFNKLTVLSRAENINKKARWHCLCECGNKSTVMTSNLKNGHTKSCGCLAKVQKGKSGLPGYKSWDAMLRRCYNETGNRWHIYGGRGITVCDRWKNSFLTFLEDMGERPKGTSLDRIDNDGNYCPKNCRWATPKEQCRNKRNTLIIRAFGRSQTIREWAEETGIGRGTIEWRLNRGWTPKEALTLSVDQKEKRKKVVSL